MIGDATWRKYRGTGRRETDPALVAEYYADRPLMWRNIALVMVGNLGYGVAFTLIGPLMLLRMKACGIQEDWIGAVMAGNSWLLSVLVMFFSWQSDRLVSRFGRRTPYLLISAPVIILTAALFPLVNNRTLLLALWILQLLATDMKASTYTLILIDSVPRKELARLSALSALVPSLCNFFVLHYGMRLTHISEALPYALGAGVMLIATLCAGLGVVEAPVYSPTRERFKPWSTLAVAWQDKRAIWLMLGVGTIGGLLNVYGAWVWLFAKVELGLERTAIAEALSWSSLISVAISYPAGWVVDRYGGRRVVVAFWLMLVVMYAGLQHVHDTSGLLLMAVLQCCTAPLYAAADIMVYKSSPREHVGSVTSTNSFLRNLIAGCVMFASGLLIRHLGYMAAFTMGLGVSTLGLVLFFVHRQVTRRDADGELSELPLPVPLNGRGL
ncbi:MAG: MFS transporter [Lentisphaerae bacterium]|nr:MFS transporter [Lentisphaerota bacterium]